MKYSCRGLCVFAAIAWLAVKAIRKPKAIPDPRVRAVIISAFIFEVIAIGIAVITGFFNDPLPSKENMSIYRYSVIGGNTSHDHVIALEVYPDGVKNGRALFYAGGIDTQGSTARPIDNLSFEWVTKDSKNYIMTFDDDSFERFSGSIPDRDLILKGVRIYPQ